jgi:hypothetical protein
MVIAYTASGGHFLASLVIISVWFMVPPFVDIKKSPNLHEGQRGSIMLNGVLLLKYYGGVPDFPR